MYETLNLLSLLSILLLYCLLILMSLVPPFINTPARWKILHTLSDFEVPLSSIPSHILSYILFVFCWE
jgi:hypothetical protein